MNKAIFFDLDGTLWNALVPLTDSWNEAMIKNNKPYRFTLESMKSFMGLTPEETAVIAFNDVDLEEGMRLFSICLNAEIEYLAAHPGIMYPHEREVLESLAKKYPLFIVSNCGKGYIEDYLNALGMNNYFTDHLCIGDSGEPKWKNILMLKDKYKIDDIVYIGDTYKDKTESIKAGVKFIHAAYGFGVIEGEKNKISSLLELEDKIIDYKVC